MIAEDRAFLTTLFEAAVSAADPYLAIKAHLPKPPKGRTVVIGAGKGAAQLARAFEQQWTGPLMGVVVTRYGYDVPCDRITVLTAAHPIPDQVGLDASHQIIDALQNLTVDDLVVALICGGGSALLPMPLGDLTLEDEIDLNTSLLHSGAPISVMNAVRGQFSAIKGGRLAHVAHPAKVVTMVVSDVPGDDPAQVASGPTIPSTTSRDEVRSLIKVWNIPLKPRLAQWLETEDSEAPHPHDPAFARDEVVIVASARKSLAAAAECAREIGIPAVIISDQIEGEAKEIAKMHAAIAAEISLTGRPFSRPVVIDGSEKNAGAFVSGQSAKRLKLLGVSPEALLANHDTWTAFDALDDLFSPGPTGTNVNDFRAILIR